MVDREGRLRALDDSTLDEPSDQEIEMVTRPWPGQHEWDNRVSA